jgi:hypothetical protein
MLHHYTEFIDVSSFNIDADAALHHLIHSFRMATTHKCALQHVSGLLIATGPLPYLC